MKKRIYLLMTLWLLLAKGVVSAQESAPVVRAVLFYSPTCPHCHQVIEEILPPLLEQYRNQVHILMVDTSKENGSHLYQAMTGEYKLPRERLGVPALVVEEVVLVGSLEIRDRFQPLLEAELAAGGSQWPLFAGFDPLAAEAVFTDEPYSGGGENERVNQLSDDAEMAALGTEAVSSGADPVSFVLAALLTLIMMGAVGFVVSQGRPLRQRLQRLREGPLLGAVVLPLLVVGLALSVYLTYVEMGEVAAVCGPFGNCAFVQSTSYARILGIPVALLGVIYYLSVAILWWGQRTLRGAGLRRATAAFVLITVAGTLFSIYLGLLELFVIEAVCSWCMVSALVTTMLMIVAVTVILERVPGPEEEMALPAR